MHFLDGARLKTEKKGIARETLSGDG